MKPVELLMPLLNEGVEVWRPVAAERLPDGLYRITGVEPDDEDWAFPSGSIVASRWRTFVDGGTQLVAVPPPDRGSASDDVLDS